jgi:hypothetical protein
MELLDEGLKARWDGVTTSYILDRLYYQQAKNAMTLGPHVQEWRVDTAHPRHTRSGCHTTPIRLFRERRATFSSQR